MTKDIVGENKLPILGSDWFDPLEVGVRQQLRLLIEGLLEEELGQKAQPCEAQIVDAGKSAGKP